MSAHKDSRNIRTIGSPKLILDTDNSDLIHLPDLEEVKQVDCSIDSNKTPGPDGFGEDFSSIIGIQLKKIYSTMY